MDSGHSGGCGKCSDLGLHPHCLTSVSSSTEKREVVTIQSEVVGSGVYSGESALLAAEAGGQTFLLCPLGVGAQEAAAPILRRGGLSSGPAEDMVT